MPTQLLHEFNQRVSAQHTPVDKIPVIREKHEILTHPENEKHNPSLEVDLLSSVLLFTAFCAVVFLWAKGGVVWWERTVDPLLPSSLRPLSDIAQLGIGGLAFMSALATACNLNDLWCKVIRRPKR